MYLGVQHSFDWTDGQLQNSADSVLATGSESGANRRSLWDDKDGAIANVAQKRHLQLFFGKRIQKELITAESQNVTELQQTLRHLPMAE